MKKNAALLLTAVVLASLTGCESHSESTTNVQVTTTTDEGTTEYNYSSETTDGESTSETTVTKSPDDISVETDSEQEGTEEVAADDSKYSGEVYDMDYIVNDSGNLVINVPETNTDYWRQISFDDNNTVEFVADEIDDNGIYHVELKATVEEGEAQAVLAHFSAEDTDNAIDYAIIDLVVSDSAITEVSNSGFTDSLENK